MEEIQFLNYILSIVAVLIAVLGFYLANASDESSKQYESEIKKLKDDIKSMREDLQTKKR